ncbi:MAG TPA: hypothetical protein VJH92_03535 [Candidatus Nanoarchaeia archaeon]|nr:hypothetical protein [Candidatus Nanoarchaeia archaeon]
MDYEIKKVNRISYSGPNVVAVVNFPLNHIPARGYIFDAFIKEAYGSTEGAAKYFAERIAVIPKTREEFMLGFIFGNNQGMRFSRDMFFYPWEYSTDGNKSIRTIPYLTKDGVIQPWKIREKEDFWPILADEIRHFRISSTIEDFAKNLPHIANLEYITQ